MLKFHTLEIAALRPETRDAVCITFAVPETLGEDYRFKQGQHLSLEAEIDGERLRRPYSICTGVEEGTLQVAIKRHPGGRFSNYANDHLRVGQRLRVLTPTGRFHSDLDATRSRRYVAFAAGSGITPVLSIIKTVLQTEPDSEFTLFYGNRTADSIMFRGQLADLKDVYTARFRLFHILSAEAQDIDLYNGRIDGDKCRELCRALLRTDDIDEWFICGPGSMIEDLVAALVAEGVDGEHIHFERFRFASPAAAAPETGVAGRLPDCEVTVILDGSRKRFEMRREDPNVLAAGVRAGLELPFSCKGGVCSTCRARLVDGEVDMTLNYALEPWELEAGFVLTCQSRPKSTRLVLDFDQT